MIRRLSSIYELLLDQYLFALLTPAQLGVGNPVSVGMICALLCGAGLGLRQPARVAPWIAVPMAGYLILGALSAWRTFGNPAESYPSTHLIFLTIYLLMACMDNGEVRTFKRLSALRAGCAAAINMGMVSSKP